MQSLSLKKEKVKKTTKRTRKTGSVEEEKCGEVSKAVSKLRDLTADELGNEEISNWYPDLPSADDVLYKRRQHMNGFPRSNLILL